MTDLVEAAEPKGNARAVCFTLHRCPSGQLWRQWIDKLMRLVPDGDATYIVFQFEICPDTQREHIQGYVEFKNSCKWNKLNSLCGFKAHIEKRKGTSDEAAAYCKKAESRKPGTHPWEDGVISKGQGARTDLASVQKQLDSRTPMEVVSRDNFSTWVKYHKAFAAYKELQAEKRTSATISIVLFGLSNVGKSHLAFELFPDCCTVNQGNCGVWWDHYTQQETVIFDEFSGWIKFADFKRLIDRYDYTCDSKGATKRFNSRFVVFTSNKNPMDWYTNVEDDTEKDAFTRRLHIVLQPVKVTVIGPHDPVDEIRCHILGDLVLPYGAKMRPGWVLGELSPEESIELLGDSTDMSTRIRLATKSRVVSEHYISNLITLRSKGHEVTRSRSAGVILSPALLDANLDFYTAARDLLQKIFFRTAASAAACAVPSVVPSSAAAEAAAAATAAAPPDQLTPGAKKWTEAMGLNPLDPPNILRVDQSPPAPSRQLASTGTDLLKALGLRDVDRSQQYAAEIDWGSSPSGLFPKLPTDAKPAPVRHDQVYRKPYFKSNYPSQLEQQEFSDLDVPPTEQCTPPPQVKRRTPKNLGSRKRVMYLPASPPADDDESMDDDEYARNTTYRRY